MKGKKGKGVDSDHLHGDGPEKYTPPQDASSTRAPKPRPVGLKTGGKVHGKEPHARADKKARGGGTKFIQKAIKHPGREKERAARNGVSTHEQMEKDSHSSDPSVRGAGKLGLRLSAMSKHKKG